MAKYDIFYNDDDIKADDEIIQNKGSKKPRFPKEERVNKRMSNKLNKNIEKNSVEEKNSIETLLNKISAGATLKFPDDSEMKNEMHVVRVAGSEKDSETSESRRENNNTQRHKNKVIVRVEYGPVVRDSGPDISPEEFCRNINLKFVTSDPMVLKIFQDPLNIPKGTKYLITDQYFEYGCLCAVEQIVRKNKSGTMLVFKRLDTGGITTYTDASIKDAKEIRHIKQ